MLKRFSLQFYRFYILKLQVMSNSGSPGRTVEETLRPISPKDELKEGTEKRTLLDQDLKTVPSEGAVMAPQCSTSTYNAKYTTEIHKIEIKNLPKVGFSALKKFIKKLCNFEPVKINYQLGRTFAFVTFRNDDLKEEAIEKLNGAEWKGRKLIVKVAKPAVDPMRKRKPQYDGEEGEPKRKSLQSHLSPEERVAEACTPLWCMPYKEQLELKQGIAHGAVRHITKAIKRDCKDLEWLKEALSVHKGLFCKLEELVASPVENGYRNKCEFTVGPSVDGYDKTVGFRVGSYKEGDLSVVPPQTCVHVPEEVKCVVKVVQEFIDTSPYSSFSPLDNSGNWRQVAIRFYTTGESMLIFQFHPQDLSTTDIAAEEERMKKFFTEGPGASLNVNSVYLQVEGRKLPGNQKSGRYALISGQERVHEVILGMKFRISKESFFQVNTKATEVMYKLIGDFCGENPNATLYDICCGTGSIGLCMAKHVQKVIGIEMVPQAVEDARINAEINGVQNVEFHSGKAEDVLPQLMINETAAQVIGIIDPPRGGLQTKVINAIRKCRSIQRLVYVACNAENEGAISNFVALCRPNTKHSPGLPFKPVKAIPVDLFPHTNHYELVVCFDRSL